MRRVLAVLVTLSILAAILIPTNVEAAAWYSTYAYAKPITITGSADGAMTNYQMKFMLHKGTGADTGNDIYLNNHALTTWDATHAPTDIRFMDSNNDTVMDYWVDTYTADTATVWIEFNTIPASPSTAVFNMFYGLSGAASVSSGTNTFIFFDDFERGSNGDTVGGSWTETKAHCEISTTQAFSGTRSVRLSGGPGEMTYPLTAANTYAVRCRLWTADATTDVEFFRQGNGTRKMCVDISAGTANEHVYYYSDADWIDTGKTVTKDSWSLFGAQKYSWASGYTYDISRDDVVFKTGAPMYASTSSVNVWAPSNEDSNASHYYYMDDCLVRNFTTNEPTWAFSSEVPRYEAPNEPPSQPSNVSPANAATWVTLTPTLQSSAFYDPDIGHTHAGSQWQISTNSGDYSSTVFDSGTDTSNLVSTLIPSGKLNYSTIYYWRVRHQDSYGVWSNWSADTSFTTRPSPDRPPDTPGNASPTDAATATILTPTLQSSSFSDPDTGDYHNVSQWQVRTSTDTNSTVFDSGTDASNLTSITVPTGKLAYSTTYYWRVRHQDSYGVWSNWSADTSFTTCPLPDQPPDSHPPTSTRGTPWWVWVLSVVGIASVGGIGLTYYWRKNNGKPNSRTPRQPPPQSSAGDFDSVRSLIGETEGVLKKALNDAVATNDSLWLGALRFLKEELSDLSRRIELGTIAYAEARVRILDLRKRVDSLRNPPRREPVGAEPKSAAMKDLPMEELVDIILNVSRNADGYDVLGVSRGASKEDIDTAFKQKQHGWHPDKFPSANDKKLANAVSTRLNNAKDQIYKERGWK